MYPGSTRGANPNNDLFSSCSRTQMWSVLQARSAMCFASNNFLYPLMFNVPKWSSTLKSCSICCKIFSLFDLFGTLSIKRLKSISMFLRLIIISLGFLLTVNSTIKKIWKFKVRSFELEMSKACLFKEKFKCRISKNILN